MSDPTRGVTAPPEHTADPPPNLDTRTLGEATNRSESTLDSPVPDLAAVGYVLKGEIGSGGMGIVYRAHDTSLNRDIAVKVLHDRYTPTSHAAIRFVEEARITGQLQHPGIPPIHEVGTLPDGRPFIAMKLIKGRTLHDLLPERTNLRATLITAFEQMCQAVGYAHSHGVIHRDLKPQNVMIGAFGETQVMDWGLAKFRSDSRPPTPGSSMASTFYDPREDSEEGSKTRAGAFLGTPAYMPPEQAIGAVDRVDERSDVFGLGGVLCAILTGEPPFLGADSESTRQLAAQGKLEPAFARLDTCGAEPELIALCKQCLASDPENRPKHGGEVAHAVAAFRGAAEDRARQAELDQVTAQLRVVEIKKRRQIARIFAVAVMLALLTGGIATYVKYRDEATQRTIAEDEKRTADRERSAAEAETAAKEQALRQLTEQQTATEEALVRGILRPLQTADRDYRSGARLSADESRALSELSRLPERLQLRFLELALTSPGGPEKVRYRAFPIVHTIAMLDRDRATRLRAAIDNWFAAALGGPSAQLACVALAISLPPAANADAAMAEFLADRLVDGSEAQDGTALLTLLRRLDRPRAAAIAQPRVRALTDLIIAGKRTQNVYKDSANWEMLVGWMDPTEASDLARSLARIGAERMQKGPTAPQRDEDPNLPASLLDRIPRSEAAAIARPLIQRAYKSLQTQKDRPYIEQIGMVQAFSLARYLDDADVEAILKELSGWFTESTKSSDPYRSMAAMMALISLAERLPPARRRELFAPHIAVLTERVLKEPKNPFTSMHVMVLGQVAERLPRGELSKTILPLARTASESIGNPEDPSSILSSMGFDALVRQLDPADARAIAGPAAKRLYNQIAKPNSSATYFMTARDSMLAEWLEPADMAEAARALAARIAVESNPESLGYQLKGLAALAPLLEPSAASTALRAIAARLTKEPNPELAIVLAQGALPFARLRSERDLLHLFKTFGADTTVSSSILSEFSRRAGRTGDTPTQAVVGFAVAAVDPPFGTRWEFIEWGEKDRPNLDFRSPAEASK